MLTRMFSIATDPIIVEAWKLSVSTLQPKVWSWLRMYSRALRMPSVPGGRGPASAPCSAAICAGDTAAAEGSVDAPEEDWPAASAGFLCGDARQPQVARHAISRQKSKQCLWPVMSARVGAGGRGDAALFSHDQRRNTDADQVEHDHRRH